MQSAKRLRNIRGLFLFFTDIMTGLPLPVHAALSAVRENNKEREEDVNELRKNF